LFSNVSFAPVVGPVAVAQRALHVKAVPHAADQREAGHRTLFVGVEVHVDLAVRLHDEPAALLQDSAEEICRREIVACAEGHLAAVRAGDRRARSAGERDRAEHGSRHPSIETS
jgi:hypothetical protein